jgi:hypothetical protein
LSNWGNKTFNTAASYQTSVRAHPDATPAQSRAALAGFLAAIVKSSNALVDGVYHSGHPTVSNGSSIENNLYANLTALDRDYAQAEAQARNLPIDSAADFNRADGNLAQLLIGLNGKARDSLVQAGQQDPTGLVKKALSIAPACRGLHLGS